MMSAYAAPGVIDPKKNKYENYALRVIYTVELFSRSKIINTGLKRDRESVSEARQVAMYIIKKNTRLRQEAIGILFGKDRTTVSYAVDTITNFLEVDKRFRKRYKLLFKQFNIEI